MIAPPPRGLSGMVESVRRRHGQLGQRGWTRRPPRDRGQIKARGAGAGPAVGPNGSAVPAEQQHHGVRTPWTRGQATVSPNHQRACAMSRRGSRSRCRRQHRAVLQPGGGRPPARAPGGYGGEPGPHPCPARGGPARPGYRRRAGGGAGDLAPDGPGRRTVGREARPVQCEVPGSARRSTTEAGTRQHLVPPASTRTIVVIGGEQANPSSGAGGAQQRCDSGRAGRSPRSRPAGSQ